MAEPIGVDWSLLMSNALRQSDLLYHNFEIDNLFNLIKMFY